ncbi:ribulose-1,5-bisphosphate carboxylase/oxygenase large subunit [Sesbania bispinosa]|nr:ribulose-1,5-bisphosphate carboxylase/oxygenase large subunit [Sesbania bispinosa]
MRKGKTASGDVCVFVEDFSKTMAKKKSPPFQTVRDIFHFTDDLLKPPVEEKKIIGYYFIERTRDEVF